MAAAKQPGSDAVRPRPRNRTVPVGAGSATTEEWSMQDIVRVSGTTSRTLRHYQREGLLEPSRTDSGGRRCYGRDELLRLQRILVLRELGLGLRAIGRLLDGEVGTVAALREHVQQLETERARLGSVADSVRATITMIEQGGELVADTMFNGFDHTKYQEEVERRWGKQAYADADAWWRSLGDEGQQAHQDELNAIVAEFADTSSRGVDVHSDEVQALARRQYEWVRTGWGGTAPSAESFTGLGQTYVDDPRFGRTYTAQGRGFAEHVRDAMAVFADRNLD